MARSVPRHHRLCFQLVTIGLVVLLPVAGWGAYRFQSYLAEHRANTLLRTSWMANRAKARVESQVMLLDALRRSIGRSLLASLARDQGASRPLAEIERELPAYCDGLYTYTPDGRPLGASSPAALPPAVVAGVLASAHAGAAVSAPFFAAEAGRWLVPFVSEINDGDVTIVVVVTLANDFIEEIAAVKDLPAGSVLTILDETGTVLFRSRDSEQWIGRNQSTVPWVQAAESEDEGVLEASAADGVLRFSAFTRAKVVPWLMYVGIPVQEVMSTARREVAREATMGFVVLGAVLALGAVLIRRIVQPLDQLAADAATLGRGNLSHRTRVCAGNEVGMLARAFNEMAAGLQEMHERMQVSEEKLRHALESTDTGTWEWDVEAGRVHGSAILERIFGLAPGAFGGTFANFAQRMHPADRDDVLRLFDQALATAQTFEVEHRICLSGGQVRWVHGRGRAAADEGGRPGRVSGVYFDVTRRKEAELALAHRLKLETLLASISTEFINLRADALDAGIVRALGKIGEAASVDRAYVFLLSADRKLADNTHEWCAAGISAQIDNLKGVPVEAVPWWAEKMRRLEIVHIPVVAELPPEAAAEKAILEPQAIQSLVAVPLESGGEWIGFLGFDAVRTRKVWADADILLLKLMAEVIARALEQRRAEARLTLLEAAVNASPSTMMITDVQGAIEWVNPAFTWNTGYTFEEAVGRNPRLLKSGRHPPEFYARMWSALASGGSWRGEIVNRNKDGGLRTDDLTIAPVQDPDGAIRHYVGIKTDITERKQAEELLQRLNTDLEQRVRERTRALEEANRELEAFSYSVSHDLRAPLRHVQGYVAILERESDGRLSDKAHQCLQTIAEASRDMGRLIDDLLAFSRMARAEIEPAIVPLDGLVPECIRLLAAAVQGREIDWGIAPLPAVLGDRALLRQVLLNLLDNAIKYTRPRATAVIEVGVAGKDDERLVVFVRDNGVGFDPQYAHKLFGVFHRLHRAEEFEGTGIGLANVRRIITRHGGRTWAEGNPGKGATFYFTLSPAPG